MGNQSAARLEGDRYQHLYSWYELLGLLPENSRFSHAIIEHPAAGAADDLTLHPHPGLEEPALYTQVKWHVDLGKQYGFEMLAKVARPAKTSMLQKLYASYRQLQDGGRFKLCLLSNWSAQPKFGKFIDGRTGRLNPEFFSSPAKDAKNARQLWCKVLEIDLQELEAFCTVLTFRLGFDSIQELEGRVDELMGWQGLKIGKDVRHLVTDVVSEWIELGGRKKEVRREDMFAAIDRHSLRATVPHIPKVQLHVHGWVRTKYPEPGTIEVDWTPHFDRPSRKVGHPDHWHNVLMPELAAASSKLRLMPDGQFVDVRGKVPLTASLAIGFNLSEAAGFQLRAEQISGGTVQHWSTTAISSNAQFLIALEHGAPGPRMLVGLEVSAPIAGELEGFYRAASPVFDSVVCLRPANGYGEIVVRSESDAVALALSAKKILHELRAKYRGKEIHLILCCPASLALFIGHRLNAIGTIHAYERTADDGYACAMHLFSG